jgi:hypothetical protein
VVETWGGMTGAWWATLQRSMWPTAVVVGGVPGKDVPQVSFAEDQDAVGELGSIGQDEAFGEAVRSRRSRRDFHGVNPGPAQDGVERGGELAGRVADEEPKGGGAVVEVDQQVAGLLNPARRCLKQVDRFRDLVVDRYRMTGVTCGSVWVRGVGCTSQHW